MHTHTHTRTNSTTNNSNHQFLRNKWQPQSSIYIYTFKKWNDHGEIKFAIHVIAHNFNIHSMSHLIDIGDCNTIQSSGLSWRKKERLGVTLGWFFSARGMKVTSSYFPLNSTHQTHHVTHMPIWVRCVCLKTEWTQIDAQITIEIRAKAK